MMASGMRIGGIASGFDTEGTIKKLVESDKVRYNKLYQTKQLNVWRKEAYNNFNKDVANFINSSSKDWGLTRNGFGTIYDSSKLSMSWLKKGVSSDGQVASVVAGATAVSGEYNVEVKELAEGIKVNSNTNSDTAKTVITDGKTIAAGSFTIETKDMTSPVTITYEAGETLEKIVSKINTASYTTPGGNKVSVGVTASYDRNSGLFFVSTKNMGSDQKLKMLDSSGSLITKMELKNTNGTDVRSGLLAGKDSKVSIDGAEVVNKSNQFTFNGMTITASKVGTTKLSVSVNTEDAYKKIKEFVDNYNKVIDSVNKKTSEKTYRDYKPLLEDQRKDMSEDDIKLWEEKAKSGLLKGDNLLEGVSSGIRSWIYEKVDGVSGSYSAAYDIGIETSSNYKEPGKLQINEKRLKEALANDPDSVFDVLFKNSEAGMSKQEKDMTVDEVKTKRRESGLVNRIYDEMISGMKKIVTKSGAGDDPALLRSVQSTILLEFTTKGAYGRGNESYLDRDINDNDKIMRAELERLQDRETSYWNRFTAMEKAISKMNAQSSWIGSQMMGR